MTCNIFVSYAHDDDSYDDNYITKLVGLIDAAIKIHTRINIKFFLDINSIEWGGIWKSIIEKNISESTFMLVFMSPSYFQSSNCLSEWNNFRDLEKRIGCNNLILPLYYRNDQEFDRLIKDKTTTTSPHVEDLAMRNFVDWTRNRSNAVNGRPVKSEIEALVKKIDVRVSQVILEFQKDSSTRNVISRRQNDDTVNPALEADIVLRFSELTATQKAIVRSVYLSPSTGEITVDTLPSLIRGVPEINKITADELYYRLKDLAHQGLIDMASIGLRQSSVLRNLSAQYALHRRGLLKT